jgi:hypothetical protein
MKQNKIMVNRIKFFILSLLEKNKLVKTYIIAGVVINKDNNG